MENQPTKLDKVVKISIIVGALIVALSIAYYLVIFLPNKQQKLEIARKDCASVAMYKAKEKHNARKETRKETNEKMGWKEVSEGFQDYYDTDYDLFFDRCLQEKGMIN